MEAVQTPIIPIVGRWIAETPGTISLGQGMVSWGPPPQAVEAARAYVDQPEAHRYGPVEGLPALVDAIAAKLRAENRLDLAASRIVVTAGGNLAFVNALLAVADPGDEVILPAPFYFNHEMAIVLAGCRPVVVPTDAAYGLQPDVIAAAITPRTRAVVTISPNNPSGAVYPEAVLREVSALCAARGVWHIHDEVYEYFTYGGARHFSPASIPGAGAHTISLYSLSKAYGFAGWRIGYMVVPEALWMAVNKIQDTLLICPPHVSQAAAVGALSAGRAYTAPFVERLAAVRLQVLEKLAAIGDIAEVPSADGAFYCLLRVRTRLDAMTLCERLIREHRVATVPGSAFGLTDGTYLRISYGALDAESVNEGIDRLVEGLKALSR